MRHLVEKKVKGPTSRRDPFAYAKSSYVLGEGGEMVNPGKPPLGSGERFAALKASIAKRGNVNDPAAVAAAIGRKKYGAEKFADLAAKGKRRAK